MSNNFFFSKIVMFMRYCGKKHGTAGQTTHDNIIWRMRVKCWIIKATDTHSEY